MVDATTRLFAKSIRTTNDYFVRRSLNLIIPYIRERFQRLFIAALIFDDAVAIIDIVQAVYVHFIRRKYQVISGLLVSLDWILRILQVNICSIVAVKSERASRFAIAFTRSVSVKDENGALGFTLNPSSSDCVVYGFSVVLGRSCRGLLERLSYCPTHRSVPFVDSRIFAAHFPADLYRHRKRKTKILTPIMRVERVENPSESPCVPREGRGTSNRTMMTTTRMTRMRMTIPKKK
jgi:hypothetical protein